MKNFLLNIVKSIMLIFFVSSTISCQNKEIQEKEAFLKSVVENCLGKKLVIPDSLITYTPFSDYLADSIQLFNSEIKIYSYINASCPTCVRDIMLWYKIIKDFEKFKIPVILICESDDNFELIKFIHEKGELKSFFYPLFFDVNGDFIRLNKFMKESQHFKTVLTDRGDNILLLGNPIRSKDMRDLYLNEIQKRINEK